MRNIDLQSLLVFLTRMEMYIYPCNKQNIVSFITGYESGAQGECTFTQDLSKKLSVKYNIKKYATGWSNQIDRYSEEKNIQWVDAFVLITSELLNESKET